MNRSAQKRLWLTIAEVSDVFGVTPRTIARWIDDGAMPGFRMPGKRGTRRVLKVKLVHFIQQRPEFHFALELLNGQPISTDDVGADPEGPEAGATGEGGDQEADDPGGMPGHPGPIGHLPGPGH